LVYVAVDFVLAFLEPQYSLLRDAESDYGAGKFSWLMDCNFLVRAGLSLALVTALARACQRSLATRLGLWLLGVWAVGSGLLAVFPDDPPGFPVTSAGKLPLLLAGLAFVAIAAAIVVLSWQMRRDVQW
jgi:hypothetical membrane protein